MKKMKKFTAAVLAAAMLAVFAGCGDQSWSYRTDNVSLSAGTYIYNLLNAYYEAYDLVESPDEAKDILKEEVTDSDENTKTVEQYSYDAADETTIKMIAVEDLFKTYGLELDQTEYDTAISYTDQFWNNIKLQFEDYGISQESFNYCYAEYNVKYGQVFEYLYGKDGGEYITDEELTEYYKNKYEGYAYFTLSMADVDEEGNSIAKSDEEFEKAQKDFDGYVKMINKDKKSYEDVVLQYTSDYELTTDPTYSGSVEKEDRTKLPADIIDAYDSLKEGEAAMVKSGEDATTLFYFIYKPATDDVVDFLEEEEDSESGSEEDSASGSDDIEIVETTDEASYSVYVYPLKSGYSHYTLLNEMKGDDFDEYLLAHAAGLNVSKNSAVVKKFKPKMFVD